MAPTMLVRLVLWLKSSNENAHTFPALLLALSEFLLQLAVLEHSYSTLEDLQEVAFILISTNNRQMFGANRINCECRVVLQYCLDI